MNIGGNPVCFSSQAHSAQVLEGSDYKPSDPIRCDTDIQQEFVGKIIQLNDVSPLIKSSVSRVKSAGIEAEVKGKDCLVPC